MQSCGDIVEKIKVIVVDDSAVVRQVNRATLERESDIEVITTCADPLVALEKMKVQWPDVIVTGIEMPRMDGITFLKKIMAERPTPIVVCSSLTEEGSAATRQALAAGAQAIITKPKWGVKEFLQNAGSDIVSAVRTAAQTGLCHTRRHTHSSSAILNDSPIPSRRLDIPEMVDKVVAMGTSTGGTQALEAVLTHLPPTTCGIVVVQHMPEKFTAMFAQRLNDLCAMRVKEASCGDIVRAGQVLIAPGGRHMSLRRNGTQYYVHIQDGPVVNRHKPSVDVLFRSVAQAAGSHALGVIMTGMGDDGAHGMKEMHSVGAQTIAEDASTCVVFGMPQAAISLGGVDKVVPLGRIAQEIIAYAQ